MFLDIRLNITKPVFSILPLVSLQRKRFFLNAIHPFIGMTIKNNQCLHVSAKKNMCAISPPHMPSTLLLKTVSHLSVSFLFNPYYACIVE